MKTKRRVIGILLAAIVLVTIAWLGRSQLSLSSLAEHEANLRSLIYGHPVQAWVAGVGLYFLISLVPGTRGKAIVVGWLYGFWLGVLLVNIALTGAALVAFVVSRYLLREWVEERYYSRMLILNKALDESGARYVILLRVVPVSFSLTNYLFGTTKIDTKTYWWATQLGLLPGNAAFVFLGAGLPSLTALVEKGVWAFLSWQLLVGLVILSLLPVLLHWLIVRLRVQSRPGVFQQPARVP